MEEREGKMNAKTNRLHNSFKVKDDGLTGRNYRERNKKVCALIVPSKHELKKMLL